MGFFSAITKFVIDTKNSRIQEYNQAKAQAAYMRQDKDVLNQYFSYRRTGFGAVTKAQAFHNELKERGYSENDLKEYIKERLSSRR